MREHEVSLQWKTHLETLQSQDFRLGSVVCVCLCVRVYGMCVSVLMVCVCVRAYGVCVCVLLSPLKVTLFPLS